MLFDGIEILEGSEVINFTLPKGTTFPSSPDQGELFYKTDVKKPYIYVDTSWIEMSTGSSSGNSTGGVTIVASMSGVTGQEGDLVYSIADAKLFVHDGVSFVVITIAYGKGKNGKTSLINNLLHVLLGDDYFITQDPTLLTTKRASSSSPAPEITELKDKGALVWEETEQSDKLFSGRLKWLLSGADLTGRNLFASKYIRFKSGFKSFLLCNNYPIIDDQSEGMWSRLLVAVFPST
jgi:hypothetical protein